MVGGKVTYTCNYGYERKEGEGFSRCQLDGKWTKPSLICEGQPVVSRRLNNSSTSLNIITDAIIIVHRQT